MDDFLANLLDRLPILKAFFLKIIDYEPGGWIK
jgi:hypothetical protein